MNTKAAITTYFINGQVITIASITPNISMALLHYLSPEQQKQSFAVALNGDFIGKADYQKTTINQEDSIDVLFPIQGG
ncbi:sulfur carrier protein ThiS [Colwellia sp. BRX8-7]|jgi:sulfur carrier protein|uniref:sulfur carrier protein ThiS n=1 Tax=Colwellia sp. BRX8-7 TaxID=2759833 RepID=UPI0015F637B0|nr:sulfur carrier protein ThiS [Colwellia sp. BRX8-7]MBA6336593.1 sulfur carrier protein ThiS [Colwellia sp. BRX8-7]|tara:strand:+ start:205 stop:438 length:234 start_codon:yes stop_codon:yes gene_type:complete